MPALMPMVVRSAEGIMRMTEDEELREQDGVVMCKRSGRPGGERWRDRDLKGLKDQGCLYCEGAENQIQFAHRDDC